MIRDLRSAFAALVFVASAVTASAQSQQCFNQSLDLQPTDWHRSITVPKFDSALGTLTSITFTVDSRIEGSAQIENLSPNSPSDATTSFQAQVTVTRPDMSIILSANPTVAFNDVLTVFDGSIDFMGSSGESHTGIVALNSASLTSPPPDSDLVLFTGAPGAGETITLPVSAIGTSIATGGGNLISQFTQSAACTVTVCYNFVGNTPPTFPTCGTVQMGSVGVPLSFQICAADSNPLDTVTLTLNGSLPPGATLTPPLPATGNPICTTFSWTPSNSDVGTTVINFTATDSHLRTAQCSISITIAECHMLFAQNSGASSYTIFGHLYDTQLAGVRRFYPVTMVDNPSYPFRIMPSQFYVQVVMYNPTVFPSNPSQWSYALHVVTQPNGSFTTDNYGTFNGIHISAQTFTENGHLRMRFPFTIDGM